MNWLKRTLEERSGKTSIKRVMLFGWFLVLVGNAIWGTISWEMITVFAMLLGNKSIESVSELMTKR